MDIKEYLNLIRIILSEDMTIHQNQYDIWQLIINMGKEGHLNDPEVLQYMLKVSKYTHKMAAYMAGKTGGSDYEDVYWKLLLFEAQCRQVDSCFLYLEKNRDKEKKFYEPRREHFLKFGIIDGFQALVDDDLDLLTISMPPGTAKTTAGIFFLASCMGWWPDMPNLASAHSGILTRSIYDGVVQILSDSIEYTWREIFPLVNFNSRAGTNSKEQTIDVGTPKRFKSLTCRAINASLTGATRCEKILYADDLCSGIEEALSRERMDKLWQTYNTDLKTRKKNQCKEIHIQTHWSTSDVVSRLKREHMDDPRARFIAIPALDAEQQLRIEAMSKLILDEVNVKAIEFVEGDGMLVKRVKCNFRTMGKKFGKQMKAVAAAVAAMTQEQISVLEGGSVTLVVEGQDVVIELEDVEIYSEDIPGWSVTNQGTLTVALDLTVTEELRLEGLARELIRSIQQLRKDSGFEISDRIVLTLPDTEDNRACLVSNRDYIASQVLANEIVVDGAEIKVSKIG